MSFSSRSQTGTSFYYHHFKNEDPSGQGFFNLHRTGINFGAVDWNFHQPGAHFHSLYYNFEKGSSVLSAGKTYDLTPDTLLYIPEGTPYDARTTSPARHAYIEFSLTTAVQPLDSIRQVEADSASCALFQRLHEAVLAQRQSDIVCLAQAILHLAFLPLGFQAQTLPEELKRVLLRITRNHFRDTTEALAGSLGQHPDRFTRWFKHYMQVTPAKYIRQAQIREAARLLRNSEKSVEEIAEECGFPNRFYFSRVFDAELGMGPGEYRRRTPTNSPLHQKVESMTDYRSPVFAVPKSTSKPAWRYVSLSAWAYRPCQGSEAWFGERSLELGGGKKRTILDIPFQFHLKAHQPHTILLASRRISESGGRPLPREVVLPVNQSIQAVYLLHTAGWVTRSVHLANYVIRYQDGTQTSFPVWAADNRPDSHDPGDSRASVQDWYPFHPPLRNTWAVPWSIPNGAGTHEAVLHVLQLTNPTPDKSVQSLTLSSLPANRSPLAVLAVTLLLPQAQASRGSTGFSRRASR